MCAQRWDAAEGLLYASRRLLSQPYVSPVYAMLLYQWLLVNKEAGGAEQRQKHVNLLVAGALAFANFSALINPLSPERCCIFSQSLSRAYCRFTESTLVSKWYVTRRVQIR